MKAKLLIIMIKYSFDNNLVTQALGLCNNYIYLYPKLTESFTK